MPFFSKASVLTNDSASKEFPITRGVCQRDPLSPFLFIIAMEGINVSMKSACQKSFYHGIKIPNDSLVLSHLFYADDVIFVRSWEYLNFSNISRILRCFHTASSLKVNFHKCNVYGVGVAEGEVKNFARVLGCGMDSLPFKFVGVSVRANMNIKRNWQSVIDQIQNKLSSW